MKSWTAFGLQVDVLERFAPPSWGSGRALGLQLGGSGSPVAVQVGVLGRLWASKLASLGGFEWPNEAPKESFGPP